MTAPATSLQDTLAITELRNYLFKLARFMDKQNGIRLYRAVRLLPDAELRGWLARQERTQTRMTAGEMACRLIEAPANDLEVDAIATLLRQSPQRSVHEIARCAGCVHFNGPKHTAESLGVAAIPKRRTTRHRVALASGERGTCAVHKTRVASELIRLCGEFERRPPYEPMFTGAPVWCGPGAPDGGAKQAAIDASRRAVDALSEAVDAMNDATDAVMESTEVLREMRDPQGTSSAAESVQALLYRTITRGPRGKPSTGNIPND